MATGSPSGVSWADVLRTKQEQTNPVSEYDHALSSPKQLSCSDLAASFSSRLPFKEQEAISSVAYPNHDRAQQFLHRGYLAGLYPVLVVSPSVHEPDILLGSPLCCRGHTHTHKKVNIVVFQAEQKKSSTPFLFCSIKSQPLSER